MMTVSDESDTHPQQRAAQAAHELRDALSTLGLLDAVPHCRAMVREGEAIVHLGDVDATTVMILAARLRRKTRRLPKGNIP
jgi:hypothetical protein